MSFAYYDLGFRHRGDVVVVTLSGSAANVRLMDTGNYHSYKSGRRHQFYGGLMRRSPAEIVVPRHGHWYVTVDMQGLRGQTRSSVQVIPGEARAPLPEYAPRRVADTLAPLVRPEVESEHEGERPTTAEYDVFISHATEDKEAIVRALATALVSEGLKVWYDEFELRIGDSLRRKIDGGLARSRFGVVVLSPAFFRKNWPQYELDGLVTREMTGRQVILPLWHQISKDEIIAQSPSLADKVARSTGSCSVAEIAREIADVIRDSGEHAEAMEG
jgi:hypothetical protein